MPVCVIAGVSEGRGQEPAHDRPGEALRGQRRSPAVLWSLQSGSKWQSPQKCLATPG